MQYHIQTAPIWEAFKTPCKCPMCMLKDKVNARLVRQYTEEAVMIPEFREKVNKYGFCPDHSVMLFNGGNKLGVSLQIETRTESINDKIPYIDKMRKAGVLAKELKEEMSKCVICQTLDDNMTRYAYTIGQMFVNEHEFPDLFEKCEGFCMPHFIMLLENAHKAGKGGDIYVRNLIFVQKRSLEKACQQLEKFTNKFDYRSTQKSSSDGNDALENAINKMHGKTI